MKTKMHPASILVVDDEQQVCQVIQKILLREGYHVSTAFSGEAALQHLKSHAVDLMMVDLKMPGMNGLELLKAARQNQKELKTILLTAYGTAGSAREAMLLGVYDFLTKPFDNRLLKKVVQEALHARAQ